MSDLLGFKVKDTVTGFTGVATAKVVYLTGCVQYCIVPESKDGKYPDGTYIDYQRLVLVSDKPVVFASSESGGDFMIDAPKMQIGEMK